MSNSDKDSGKKSEEMQKPLSQGEKASSQKEKPFGSLIDEEQIRKEYYKI